MIIPPQVRDAFERSALRLRAWVPAPQRMPDTADPAQRMFTRIGRQLTVVYAGILAAILLLSGVVLYVSMNRVLLGPVEPALDREAATLTREWYEHGPLCGSGPFGQGGGLYFIACYDSSGALISANPLVTLAPNFASSSPVRAALTSANGTALDTVDGGAPTVGGVDVGAIRREALVVRDPNSSAVLGVIAVGILIQPTLDDLHTLLLVLLGVGALTLVVSTIGGALLAGRALAPARLALDRQQHFIADAAHELRTPLTLMRADAEVLLRSHAALPADDVSLLEDIVGETAHMSALADNLLTLARLDRGVVHAEREVVDLSQIASETLRRSRALADKLGITLVNNADRPVLVLGDRLLLEQAVLILLDNGLKYNHERGTVTVTTSVFGNHATLDVSDTGIGISAEHLSRLGERFYRVDKARSREKGSVGLGVSIARRIATLHDGSLTYVSATGAGTTATLRLPVIPQNADDSRAARG